MSYDLIETHIWIIFQIEEKIYISIAKAFRQETFITLFIVLF